jgi:putative pyrroloquinoline-quinone binding quinoprotein
MSRRYALAGILVVLAASIAQAQVPTSRGLSPAQGITLDGRALTPLARVGLERNWIAVVPVSGPERVLWISLAENMLFAQTSESNLHAFNAESGQYLWGAALASSFGERGAGALTEFALPVSVNSTAVFATGNQLLFALDRKTGRTLWSKKLEALSASGTAADEERVSVGLNTFKLATYYLKNQDPAFFWQSNGVLTSRPIIAGPVIVFASQDGKVYVAAKEPPRLLFRYRTGGPISASLGTYGTRTLLIPSEDNNVYAVDLFTGETRWTYTSNAPMKQQPLVANDDVYVLNNIGSLAAINVPDGRARWTLATGGGRLLGVGEKRVYLETPFRDLFIVDRQTGQMVADPHSVRERAGLNLRDFDLTPTNPLTSRIYLASRSGMIVCLRELGRDKPFLLRDPKAPPFGFVPRQGESAKASTAPAAGTPAGDAETKPAEEKDKAPNAEKVPPPGAGENPK